MATGSNDVDEIFQRMAVIRRELHTNVRESVAGAEAFADWGRYTWTYPWIALGEALRSATWSTPAVTRGARLTRPAWPMEPWLVSQSLERGAGVREARGSAGKSCSPPGTSFSPWPSERVRITCWIGWNNNTRRGLLTGSLSRRRPRSGAAGWAGWTGRTLNRNNGCD